MQQHCIDTNNPPFLEQQNTVNMQADGNGDVNHTAAVRDGNNFTVTQEQIDIMRAADGDSSYKPGIRHGPSEEVMNMDTAISTKEEDEDRTASIAAIKHAIDSYKSGYCNGTVVIGTKRKHDIGSVLTLLFENQMISDPNVLSLLEDRILSRATFIDIHVDDLPTLNIFHTFIQTQVGRAWGHRIKAIIFSRVKVGSMGAISDILSFMPNIERIHMYSSVDLSNCNDMKAKLGERIGALTKVTNFGISGFDVSIILSHMSRCLTKPLRRIYLHATIGDAIIYIVGALVTHHLENLTLAHAALETKHIETLNAFLLNTPNLLHLDLRENTLGESIIVLTHHLKHCHKLMHLNLCCTHLTDSGVKVLAESFHNWPELTWLDLGGNPCVSQSIRHLQHCHKLRNLKLRNTNLTDACVTVLAESFQHWPNLGWLDLDDNLVRNDGLKAVFKQIQNLPGLYFFSMSAYIDSQCSELVKKCLNAVGIQVPEERREVRTNSRYRRWLGRNPHNSSPKRIRVKIRARHAEIQSFKLY
ncbi:uncharacterized protein [Amphiura filiformis]|uniref:uncharacterized protein n=1 Tax=Amphiura filiformis TaxID=82378 RepID=UPI003B21A4D0